MAEHTSQMPEAKHKLSRRNILQASAGTLTIGLSGCQSDDANSSDSNNNGGDSGEGANNGDNTDGGSLRDTTFSNLINANPGDSHYNPYNPGQYVNKMAMVMNEKLFQYNLQTGEWHNRLGTELTIESGTAILKLNPDMHWADGDPVVAEDVVKQLKLEQYLDYPIWKYINGVKAVDNTTVELTMKEELNPEVFTKILNRNIVVKRDSEFKEWLNRFEEASSDDEQSQVRSEFLKFRYAADSDNPAANGPFKISAEQEGRWLLKRNEHYPVKTNIPEYEYLNVSGSQEAWQLTISERMDGNGEMAITEDIQKKFPDWLNKIVLPSFLGLAPMINQNHPVHGKREFRQALAYLIDRKLIDRNINPRHKYVENITGFNDKTAKMWLTSDFIDSLTDYGVKSKPDEAAAKMKEGGFEKQNGKWMDTEGKPIELNWLSPPWPGPIGIGEALKRQLPKFGIQTQVKRIEAGQWFNKRANKNFQFTHGALFGGPSPYFYAQDTIEANKSSFAGYPRKEVELPPIGDPDGEQQTVDLQSMLQSLATVTDEQERREHVEQYSWWFNQELPYFQLTNANTPSFIADHNWEIPATDDPVMFLSDGAASQLFKEAEEGSNQARIQGKTD